MVLIVWVNNIDNNVCTCYYTQATLGTGTATKKSILQCNVGNKSPVYLCSLFPEKVESLQINVEFEESEEVIFSVIGPRSVHLSGYYLGGHRHRNLDDNSYPFVELGYCLDLYFFLHLIFWSKVLCFYCSTT